MEQEKNGEPVVVPDNSMNPTNQPVSFYGDNSRNTDAALLAAIATKQPYEYDYAGMIGAGGICDLREEVKDAASNIRADVKDAECNIRHDVKDSESNIRREVAKSEADIRADIKSAECETIKKLGDVECKIIKENSDQTLYLTNQLSVIREQGIRNEYETKLSREQTIKEVNNKIDYKFDRLTDKIDHESEELLERLNECCCEAELAAANTQNGLVNIQDTLNGLIGGTGLK